ncbi:Purine nucleoside phosphorylase [Halotydeus destructor]|nr:Purine nucleoside phosphorylase [Halotydeus destructor]
MMETFSYEQVESVANHIRHLLNIESSPVLGLVCGTGLGPLADLLENQKSIPYSDIPEFPQCTSPGHEGRLVYGTISELPLICMKGRFHMYEGHSLSRCSLPVRVMKLLGIKVLIVTNASGGINPNYGPGTIVVLRDHLNLPGCAVNPLQGANDDRFGPRFPAMSNAYDANLAKIVLMCANELALNQVQRGIYAMTGGPSYETVAEVRMLRQLGADCVGSSTVPEVVVAAHCGLKVIALSAVTTKAVDYYDDERHVQVNGKGDTNVIEQAANMADNIKALISRTIQCLSHDVL